MLYQLENNCPSPVRCFLLHHCAFVVLCLPCSKSWHPLHSMTVTFCLSFPSGWTEMQGAFSEFPEILHLIWNISPQGICVYPASSLPCSKMWIHLLPKRQQSVSATHHQKSVNTTYLSWWCNSVSKDKNWNDKESRSFLQPLHQLNYYWYFITGSICICPYSLDEMKTETEITKYVNPKHLN